MATDIQMIPVKTIKGSNATLKDYAGKVALVVNVASKCGLTPQYEGLEKLYRKYRDKGFVVLGFPANDFMGQEPGSDEEIASFCSLNYDVTFPMFSKIAVTGNAQHPLYTKLVNAAPKAKGDPGAFRKALEGHGISPNPEPGILWNFEKFLIARDGTVAARYAPNTTPDDPELVAGIEAELARK